MSPPSPLLSAPGLVELLRDPAAGHFVLVDCRFDLSDPTAGRRGFTEATIPGSVYAHLDEDLSAEFVAGRTGRHPLPSAAQFTALMRKWGVRSETRVIAFDDRGGPYAARLWWMLGYFGHDHAQVMVEGLEGFVRAGGSLEAGGGPSAATAAGGEAFVARPRPERLADADEVLAASRGRGTLVDARAPTRFSGEHEPVDAVAGHIPGARNLPWTDNLDDRGAMADPAFLRSRFAEVAKAGSRAVLYCGSGVTACHDLLAMAHVGLAVPRLYVGSWSEWIVDESRPRATSANSTARS